MVIHCNILAWEIPWIEESGGLQSMGSQKVRHNLVSKQQQQHHQCQKTSWHLHELVKYLPKEKCSNGSSKWHLKSKQWIR